MILLSSSCSRPVWILCGVSMLSLCPRWFSSCTPAWVWMVVCLYKLVLCYTPPPPTSHPRPAETGSSPVMTLRGKAVWIMYVWMDIDVITELNRNSSANGSWFTRSIVPKQHRSVTVYHQVNGTPTYCVLVHYQLLRETSGSGSVCHLVVIRSCTVAFQRFLIDNSSFLWMITPLWQQWVNWNKLWIKNG